MSLKTTATFSPFFRQPESRDTVLWMQACAVCQVTEAAAATLLYFSGSTFLWAEKCEESSSLYNWFSAVLP